MHYWRIDRSILLDDNPDQMLHKTHHITIISNHILIIYIFFGINLTLEISLFGVIGMDFIIIGHWKATGHNIGNIFLRRIKQLCNMWILLTLMIFILKPTLGIGTVPLNNIEVTVQKEYDIILHLLLI